MSRRDNFIQHARGTPFDIVGNSLRKENLQEVAEELRKQTVYDPEHTVTSASGDLNLSTTSSTLHFLTGSALGFDINLPNATTLFEGQSYILVNESTSSVSIKDSAGTQIFELLAESIAIVFLQDNATSAGLWVGYVVSGFATGILSYNVTSSTLFTTTSATDVVITGFTVTPVAGRYAVWFNARMQSSSASATNNWRIYKDGVGVADSDRGARFGAASTDFPCSTQTVISVNGSQAVDVRVRRTGGTLSVFDRTVTLIRLGPEV
jgi:hypothetical protein